MKRLSRIIGVATLVLMATAGPAAATRGQPDHTVPITGTVLALDSGQIFPDSDDFTCPETADWLFFSNGTGTMPHLGRVDLALTQCSNYVVPPFVGASVGTATFTAANGDVLVLSHALGFEVVFNDIPAPDGFEGTGTWTVLEGTGRFVDATGAGTMHVLGDVPTDDTPMFDLPAGGTLWTFAGEIVYDASNRSA